MRMFEEVQQLIEEFDAESSTVYQSEAECYLSVVKYKIGEDHWISLVDQCGNEEPSTIHITGKGMEVIYKALKEIYK